MAELIFPTWFDEKTTIAQDDMILMADSEDWNKIKKAKYSYLKGDKWDPWQNWQDWQDWHDGADWKDWTDGTDWASIVSWAFVWDDLVFDKDDWTSVTIENAKTTLQWPEWEEWPEWPQWPAWQDWADWADWADWEDWNWIASITATKAGKITTVTITETSWNETEFEISDWQDGQGSWDVIWPNSSTDWNVVAFDWTTWKLIKDWSVSLATLSAWASAWATAVQPWDIWTAAACNTWTGSWNVPVLDSNWKLATSTLPWVALTDTYTVSTSADLTTLSSADQWDIAIVTSENKTYVLSVAPYSTAANWKEILAPTWWVTSFNWQTWAVTYSAPVSSVNTQTWAVTVNDVKIAASAPTGSEWMVWYDTTNDKLKSYDWSSWNVVWDWDVTWPASSTDWHLALFDGVTWKLIKDWWAVPTWVPAVWTNWQVLTVVSWAAAWANATWGWIQNDTTWTTTTVTAIRAWTEAEYNSLWSHSASVIYHIY